MNAQLTAAPLRGSAWLPWLLFGMFIAAGVGLALLHSPRITPLLEIARLQGAP